MSDVEVAPKPWPRVVVLKYPIDFGSEHIASLEFRRGRMGDIKGMKLGNLADVPVNDLVTLASRLCGQPTQVIEMLDVEDAGEVTDIALDFLASCLATGRTR